MELPPRDFITSTQLHTLVNAATQLYAFAVMDPMLVEENTPQSMDGGVKMAAANSLIRIFNRIDEIADDSERWTLEKQNVLETALLEMYQANIEALKAQKMGVSEAVRPSFRYRPTLFRIEEGWTAIMGDPKDSANCVVGVGTTPEEAYLDFDTEFAGQHVAEVRPLKTNDEQTIEVDSRATPRTEVASGHRRKSRRNRKSNGPKQGGDKQQAE